MKPLVPRSKKRAIERGIVGGKLRYLVGFSIRGDHRNAGLVTKKFGEMPGDLLRFQRLPGPEASAIMILSEAITVGRTLVKANLRFKGTDWFKVVIDGDRGQLQDGVFLWV